MARKNLAQEDNNILLDILSPYTYLSQVRGEQFAQKIPMAFNYWLKVPNEKLREVMKTVGMLQGTSLLIDDIQDDSKVRRGMPAAHCVYGVPLTINTSLHVICLAFARANNLDSKAGKIVMEQFHEAVVGQGCDIYWRDNFVCPTEEQYLKMVEQKTGARFMLTIELMQLFSERKTDFSNLISLLGRYIQIRDDYCNLTQEEALEEWLGAEDKKTRKEQTFCEDITEGKFSFPIIHAIKTWRGEEILDILRKRTKDVCLKNYCVSMLEEVGSLQYTQDKLEELDQKIRNEVDALGGNPLMIAIQDALLDGIAYK